MTTIIIVLAIFILMFAILILWEWRVIKRPERRDEPPRPGKQIGRPRC